MKRGILALWGLVAAYVALLFVLWATQPFQHWQFVPLVPFACVLAYRVWYRRTTIEAAAMWLVGAGVLLAVLWHWLTRPIG